jgi:hypothetical protein
MKAASRLNKKFPEHPRTINMEKVRLPAANHPRHNMRRKLKHILLAPNPPFEQDARGKRGARLPRVDFTATRLIL